MKREFVKPNLFISACIEFESCRFDGTMISDKYVRILTKYAKIYRVCPEMSIGLSAPRDSLRLIERKGESLKLVETKTETDLTTKMNDFSNRYLSKLKDKNIDGFIMKAKSPTCGVKTAKIYFDTGKAHVKSAKNAGLFGQVVLDMFPNVPVETERRISNFNIRDRFFIQIFTLAEFRILKENKTMKKLVQFHSINKYLFMGYNQLLLKQMGNVVANHNKLSVDEVYDQYETLLRNILSKELNTKKRINVLTHIYGYFKKQLNPNEKEYYFDLLDDYLNSKIPYSTILSLLESWVIRFNEEYLLNQTIFNPYPKELITVLDSGKNI